LSILAFKSAYDIVYHVIETAKYTMNITGTVTGFLTLHTIKCRSFMHTRLKI